MEDKTMSYRSEKVQDYNTLHAFIDIESGGT